jgi:hypothetical protein
MEENTRLCLKEMYYKQITSESAEHEVGSIRESLFMVYCKNYEY